MKIHELIDVLEQFPRDCDVEIILEGVGAQWGLKKEDFEETVKNELVILTLENFCDLEMSLGKASHILNVPAEAMKRVDERVAAIRKDPKVGRGSCTSFDECCTDEELAKELDEEGITTPEQAVEWAREIEGLRIENATNFREGTDNDPEIKRLREWEEE